MYVYMYLCIYVSMYVCMYVYMYVCMYVLMYVCMYVCTSSADTAAEKDSQEAVAARAGGYAFMFLFYSFPDSPVLCSRMCACVRACV